MKRYLSLLVNPKAVLSLVFSLVIFNSVYSQATQSVSVCPQVDDHAYWAHYDECAFTNLQYDQCNPRRLEINHLQWQGSYNNMHTIDIWLLNANGTLNQRIYYHSAGAPTEIIANGTATPQSSWREIVVDPIPLSGITTDNRIRVGIWGYYCVQGNTCENFYLERSINLDVPLAPSPPTNTSNTCNSTTFSWNNGASLACLDSDAYTEIWYAGGSHIATVPRATTSYTVNTSGDHNYSIRHTFASTGIKGAWSTGFSPAKQAPSPPSGLDASDDRCDGKIRLEWIPVANADDYHIYRDGVFLYATGNGSVAAYVDDDIALQRGYTYSYEIYAHEGACGWSVASPPETGVSPAAPEGSANVWLDIIPNVGIEITFNKDSLAQSYKIERNLLGGGGASFFDVPAGDTSYLDQSLTICQTYEYRVLSLNSCATQGIAGDSSRQAALVPDFSAVFNPNSLDASKGYYPNRVELSWTVDNNETNINAYKIYRRVLGSGLDSILITSQNSGSNLYQDNLIDAGVLYEYFIIAEAQCEQSTIYSNATSSIGFRSVAGTIAGQVSYAGGVAVENVKIEASSSIGSTGTSLLLSGNDSIVIDDNNNFDIIDEFTLELWINPANQNDYTLASKEDVFSLKHIANQMVFEVFTAPGVSQSISVSSAGININNYHQITASVFNDSIRIYINGQSTAFALLGANVNSNSNPLILGKNLTGNIDEFRLWNIGKSNDLVNRDFSRILNGVHANLQVYLRMDETTGDFVYDFSRVNNNNFNRNHGEIFGASSWSNIIPLASQLAIAAYTNAQGNYFLSVPYSGIGETFVLTPSYLVHNFSPATTALFIGDGSSVHNNIDFEDISSFTVQGSLFFANTSCPVEAATLYVDGNIVVVNGQPAQTDAFGQFNIQVPIGEHYITIEKNNHIMSAGRFPDTSTYNFQNDLAGIGFIDTTLVKVVGRVVGGLKQASFIPGLGKSTNNIGQAQIILTSQLGGGCSTDTILTDMLTGEYTTYLPPLRYVPTVSIPSNFNVNFGTLNLVDITNDLTPMLAYDTIGYDSTNNIYFIDSITFNTQLDYIHRNDPKLVVKATNLVDDFIGDTLYTYIHHNGDTIIRNLNTNPLPWPVFNGISREEGEDYSCLITAFEEYQNLQTGALDTVPTTDGQLTFNNQIASFAGGSVNLSDVNKLDTLKYVQYTFPIGIPNFNENVNIPEYNFVKKFELNLSLPNGVTVPWLPDVFQGTGSAAFNAVYDKIFRAYVLGSKSDGAQFLTEGPQLPEYILRDPPGSNSYASREVGSTKSSENTWSWSLGGTSRADDHIYLGQKFNSGIGVAIETDVLQDITFGSESSVLGGRNGKESQTITNTQAWSTDATPTNPGKNSDLYMGKSKNVSFGIKETLRLVPDSICSQTECVGPLTSGLTMAKTYGVSIVPKGYNTQFIYSEDHIKNQLIPDLVNLRNALLSNPTRYTSVFPNTHKYYGLNNDDPRVQGNSAYENTEKRIAFLAGIRDESYTQLIVVGTSFATTETHYRSTPAQFNEWTSFVALETSDSLSISGDSYIFHATNQQDSLTGDSVRWINDQIRHWEEAIMLNEWEKLNVNNTGVRDVIKGVQLTKLYDEYEDRLIAYTVFAAAGGAGGAVAVGNALASQALPGPTSYIKFAVVTGVGIAENELYKYADEYLNARDAIYTKYAQSSANYSVSSGATFTSAITHESASTLTRSLNINASVNFALELSSKINNIGVATNKGIQIDYSSGKDWTKSSSNTETVSFTLYDQDPGDFFSVDVHASLFGWGPVFSLQPGGKTSCPHEDVVLTEYYIEDTATTGITSPYSPYFVLSEATQQVEKPTIDAAPTLLTNIPVTDAAVYNLTVNNESESNDTRTYKLALLTTSNPFGAIVTVDGSTSFADVTIPANSSINKVLAVEKGPGPTYNYDSLIIIVYSDCQPDIVDSVYVSAHFLPTCTEVTIANPSDQWVLNNSFSDTMPIGIIDYNINFFDFNSIRLDYKPSSQSTWTGLKTFHKDTAGLNDPTATEIPTNTPFTLWDWETDQIVDGDYDLRLVSQCTLADKISLTHTGLMDRINPHPFGTPSPADGILDPNDDISIRFNEPVDLGSITSLNFDVRGIINGTETNHSSNLYFDGVDDYVEVTAGLPVQNRDFTIDFSVKRATTGQECIMSQGEDANEQLFIGFNAADQLELRFNNQSITSTNTFTGTNWHYISVAYNEQNETLEMYEASGISTASIINTGNTSLFENFSGVNKLLIGKDAAGMANHFTGNIDDIRVWNKTRSLPEFSLTKSQLLSGSELGLLYNWRFDDADGIFATDHVRQRDGVINGPIWTIEPQGNSASFDGVDDYVRVDKGNVNITDEMDFTLEFWFNSTQTDSATMISNGTGTGLSSDSIFSWNIAKDDLGMIHVYHNGLDFVATNNNYFDGEWHHIALVLNRQANLTSYIDGNLENSIQALPYREIGGSGLYIGARGYYTGVLENFDKHFNGQLDEFRLWNTARTYEQIARDKQNRMLGTEMGLLMYMPFENYTLTTTGVSILTASFDEQILNNTVTNPNGSVLNNTPPKVKIQRPVESIAFTYSINGDEIIITPTTSSELIENVTLDITVSGIKDLHGNVMQSPKTWIAYMDKNQVVWQDDLLAFDKDFGAGLTFTSAVVNNGGAAKLYDITNLPSWLTTSQTSGSIAPNSIEQITFTVDPNVNIGNYFEDIHLTTDFGFAEKLTLDLTVRAEEPVWTVNPADYNYSMSIVGYLKIEDVVSTDDEDILGVFVNDSARGAAHLQYVPSLDRYLVFLDVYSNVTNGESLSFKIWDASKGAIYTDVMPSLNFVANDLIGNTTNPQLFEAGNVLIQNINIVEGWNWIGFNLLSNDSANLNVLMQTYSPDDLDELKGQYTFANYSNSNLWNGPLDSVGVQPELGYRLKALEDGVLSLAGSVIDPTTRNIDLVSGWNWIGFISVRNQSVTQALANFTPDNGDLIKGKSQFAVYDNLLGWIGSLSTLKPGESYMYKAANAHTFTFPYAGFFKSSVINNEVVEDKRWPVNHNIYPSNMTHLVAIDLCSFETEETFNSEDWFIGVFDDNNECRTLNAFEILGEELISFVTISGAPNENLQYRLLNKNTSESIASLNTFKFVSNEYKTDFNYPYVLGFDETACKKIYESTFELVQDEFMVYPSVFEDEFTVVFNSIIQQEISINLVNSLGQKMLSKKFKVNEGRNSIVVESLDLVKGIYYFELTTEDKQVERTKLIRQ